MTLVNEPDVRRSRRWRRRAASCALVGVALLAAACGGGGSSSPNKAAAKGATTTAPPLKSATVIVNGKSVTVPTEANGMAVEQGISTGQNIVFTAKGFLPGWLFAAKGEPITFTNLSSRPVTITCPPMLIPAFTIQPGEAHTITPTPGIDQFEYVTPQGFHGKAQVGVFDQ